MAYTTIDDPSAHFQAVLYTGTGSTQSITNDGNSDLKPDWVWVKKRDGTESHALSDSTRGTSATLFKYAPPSGFYALCTKNLAEEG